ncbi:MAG: DNA cytosine methyltransferase [Prevotellaceae bacterium]|jgi:hypothetical protein|nr:DNA cytosine methyltransferase [Prevotellaceae bacterium]
MKKLLKAAYNKSEQILTLVYYRAVICTDNLADAINNCFAPAMPEISTILLRNLWDMQGLEIECPQRLLPDLHLFLEEVTGIDFKIKKMLTHASYFAGIGGFCLGAERAGIETVYTCEIDQYRHEWLKYKYANANAKHETDIRTSTGIAADIFSAGFPCQDISIANPKGKGLQGERSGLLFDFFAAVSRFRPQFFVLENSPNVISKKEIALQIFGEIATLRYNAEWAIIPKRAFGYADERAIYSRCLR